MEIEEVIDCPRDPNRKFARPENFDLMIDLAEKVSDGHRFLRVDFYDVNGHIFFGETTFFPASGMGKLGPEDADSKIGKLLIL